MDLMAQEILNTHNDYRAAVGVAPLVWSERLTRHASDWAEHLTARRLFKHSSVPDEGENLWMGTSGAFSYRYMIDDFGSEQRYFKSGRFPEVSRTGSWQDVGHYTQMIWKETQAVGCAGYDGPDGNYRLVCRYSPPGNVIGEPVY